MWVTAEVRMRPGPQCRCGSFVGAERPLCLGEGVRFSYKSCGHCGKGRPRILLET